MLLPGAQLAAETPQLFHRGIVVLALEKGIGIIVEDPPRRWHISKQPEFGKGLGAIRRENHPLLLLLPHNNFL